MARKRAISETADDSSPVETPSTKAKIMSEEIEPIPGQLNGTSENPESKPEDPESAKSGEPKAESESVKTKRKKKRGDDTPVPIKYTPRLVEKTVKSAIAALISDLEKHERIRSKQSKHTRRSEQELMHADNYFTLIVTMKFPPKEGKLRPSAIPVKHPFYVAGEDEICLFVKDPQRLVKDYFEKHGNNGVTRVMGVEKLRKRYGTHEGRRELYGMYDLFLVDKRVQHLMPRLLGKKFADSKKLPVSVDMDRHIAGSVKRAISSTPFAPRQGTCTAVRVARSFFTEEQVYENLEMVVEGVVTRMRSGWDDIQSLAIKTNKSPALDIYITLPAGVRHLQNKKRSRKLKGSKAKAKGSDGPKAEEVGDSKPEKSGNQGANGEKCDTGGLETGEADVVEMTDVDSGAQNVATV